MVGGDDCHQRFADHLINGVAEQSLGARVPTGDNAVEIPAENGVLRGLYDRRQVLGRQKLPYRSPPLSISSRAIIYRRAIYNRATTARWKGR